MALYLEKLARDTSLNTKPEPLKALATVPTNLQSTKVVKEEVKVAVLIKDCSEDKENKSDILNNLHKLQSPIKPKPLVIKQ